MDHKRVLVIDDEENLRHMLSVLLKKNGFRVDTAADGAEGLQRCRDRRYDFILCDIRMPEMDGIEFLRRSQEECVRSTVIMMSAYGTVDTAIECMKNGAYDYVSKPFNRDEILLVLRKAEERERLKAENLQLREELAGRVRLGEMVSRDPKMLEIFELVKRVAAFSTTVLILGESGTGKELVARAIHYGGARREHEFVAVNCGAMPENLLESELFGHVKGAFTDASADKPGLFELANEGTLFLDEVGEMSPNLQVKLLRVLQEGEIRRVGAAQPTKVDVRVVSATSRDMARQVAEGHFREDLYYRLNVLQIKLPPLRERIEDIPHLAEHFLAKHGPRMGRQNPRLAPQALRRLMSYRWPGNVRELENCIERSLVLADGEVIADVSLPHAPEVECGSSPVDTLSLKVATERLERTLIARVLDKTGGNRTQAAKVLEISLRGLLYKLKEYGME